MIYRSLLLTAAACLVTALPTEEHAGAIKQEGAPSTGLKIRLHRHAMSARTWAYYEATLGKSSAAADAGERANLPASARGPLRLLADQFFQTREKIDALTKHAQEYGANCASSFDGCAGQGFCPTEGYGVAIE